MARHRHNIILWYYNGTKKQNNTDFQAKKE